jgi:O-antigen ligase
VLTLSFRPGIWQQVMAEMPGHWLLGRGCLVDPQVNAYGKLFSHAHNSYLATLRDGGAVGLVLLLGLLGLALVWAGRLWARGGERIYLALLLFGMTAVIMDFDRLLVHPKELWLFFWLPLALVMAAYPVWADGKPAPQAGAA